ncbi:hypothetical protein SUGI_1130890 [Cryptomeria japonica]|nr:hypothetical protein SUGI_1130890 [Cryptomeria japonica]
MLTLCITSSPGPTVDPPSYPVVIQLDGSSLENSLATPMVFDPIPDKNVLVRNTETVDPNIILAYLQIEEGMSLELPDIVLDHILQNMANTLVGKIFSLCPMVEMVRKWVKDKWKLKGSVSISVMHGALFLLKFTTEEDVALVLSGCWSYA